MKITEDYNDNVIASVLEVVTATYTGDYKIDLIFNDRSEKRVDFKPFLSKSLHPSIAKYIDEVLFCNFEIKDGNLNWNDYDLIFPISELYEGEIQ